MMLASSTEIAEPTIHPIFNTSRDTANMLETVLAGLAVLFAVLSFIVGLLHLRSERNKRRQAHDMQVESAELEAEISEVRIILLPG